MKNLNLKSSEIRGILSLIKLINSYDLENIYIDDKQVFPDFEVREELKLIGLTNWFLVKEKFNK